MTAGTTGSNTRASRAYTVTIAENEAVSSPFNFTNYAMGIIHMPDAWTEAGIGFLVAAERDGDYLPLHDDTGVMVEVATPEEGTAVLLPAALAPARWVKLWSQAAGEDEAQGAARTLVIGVMG